MQAGIPRNRRTRFFLLKAGLTSVFPDSPGRKRRATTCARPCPFFSGCSSRRHDGVPVWHQHAQTSANPASFHRHPGLSTPGSICPAKLPAALLPTGLTHSTSAIRACQAKSGRHLWAFWAICRTSRRVFSLLAATWGSRPTRSASLRLAHSAAVPGGRSALSTRRRAARRQSSRSSPRRRGSSPRRSGGYPARRSRAGAAHRSGSGSRRHPPGPRAPP
jgi:hypothetical protein